MQYELLNKVIKGGKFEKQDILNKLDVYMMLNKITLDQYNELMLLINIK